MLSETIIPSVSLLHVLVGQSAAQTTENCSFFAQESSQHSKLLGRGAAEAQELVA
jgi:hypothetical protein